MSCANGHCGRTDAQQRALTPGEIDSVGHAPWTTEALRCVYCGCVYQMLDGAPVILGYFDGMFIGWRPN